MHSLSILPCGRSPRPRYDLPAEGTRRPAIGCVGDGRRKQSPTLLQPTRFFVMHRGGIQRASPAFTWMPRTPIWRKQNRTSAEGGL